MGVVINREEFKRKALEELRKADQNLYEKLRKTLEGGEPWARVVLENAYRLNLLFGFEESVKKLRRQVEAELA